MFVYDGFEEGMAKARPDDAETVKAILRKHFCEFGRVKSKDKWNANEGTYKIDGRRVKLQAATGHQCRAYGVVGSWIDEQGNKVKTLFVSDVNPKKKSTKARRGTLELAAKKAIALIDEIQGATE